MRATGKALSVFALKSLYNSGRLIIAGKYIHKKASCYFKLWPVKGKYIEDNNVVENKILMRCVIVYVDVTTNPVSILLFSATNILDNANSY